MKRILKVLSFLVALSGPVFAGVSYDLPVSSGTGYRTVDMYKNDGTSRDRQAIVIGDRTSSGTVTVDPAGWMKVQLSTSTNNIGNVNITSTNTLLVDGSGVVQPVSQSGAWNLSNSTVGVVGTVSATQSGLWNLSNSTVGVVGTVAATQSGLWNLANSTVGVVQVGTWNLANSTVGVVGTVAATQSGLWNLSNSTVGVVGTIAATQSGLWNLSNSTVGVSSIQGQLPAGANNLGIINIISTTTIPVSGSFSASSVDITTAAANAALPQAAEFVGGVGPSGTLQSFAVDASSNMKVAVQSGVVNIISTTTLAVSGSFSASSVDITTAAANATLPQAYELIAGVGPSGVTQSFAVDASSNIKAVIQAGSVALNIVSTNTMNVAQQGGISLLAGQSLTNSTFTLVGTTITIQNIQQALPAGSNSLGNVNIISTNTMAVSGSFSASLVNITTATPPGALPQAGVFVGGVGPNGQFQSFAVDSSSQIKVTTTVTATVINTTTGTFNTDFPTQGAAVGGVGPSGKIQTFAVDASSNIKTFEQGGVVNIISTGTLAVSGSFSASSVDVTTAAANAALPQAAEFVGGVGPSGNLQSFAVTAASAVYVSVVSSGNVTLFGSTVAVSAIQGTVTVGAHAITNTGFATSVTSGVVNIISTATVPVSLVAGQSVTNSTFTLVGTTIAVSAIQGALPAGSNSLGVVNVISTGTVAISGSITASFVDITTAAANAATPQAMEWVGGVNWAGTGIQSPRVDLSSNTMVYVANLSTQQLVNTTVAVQGMESDSGALAGANRLAILPGVYFSSRAANLNGTANTVGRNASLKVGVDGLLATSQYPSNARYSYTAATNTITLAATASDVTALCGNASNTVLVYGLSMTCTQTTAGTVNLSVMKRSSAYTGAYSTMTATPQDSNYSVVLSTAIWFTANPATLGTEVGHLDDAKIGCDATGTASPNDIYMNPPEWRVSPIVLRGATQCVAVYLNRQTVTGGIMTARWSWIEDPSL